MGIQSDLMNSVKKTEEYVKEFLSFKTDVQTAKKKIESLKGNLKMNNPIVRADGQQLYVYEESGENFLTKLGDGLSNFVGGVLKDPVKAVLGVVAGPASGVVSTALKGVPMIAPAYNIAEKVSSMGLVDTISKVNNVVQDYAGNVQKVTNATVAATSAAKEALKGGTVNAATEAAPEQREPAGFVGGVTDVLKNTYSGLSGYVKKYPWLKWVGLALAAVIGYRYFFPKKKGSVRRRRRLPVRRVKSVTRSRRRSKVSKSEFVRRMQAGKRRAAKRRAVTRRRRK